MCCSSRSLNFQLLTAIIMIFDYRGLQRLFSAVEAITEYKAIITPKDITAKSHVASDFAFFFHF